MTTRVLVLGASGMLGAMVLRVLRNNHELSVTGSTRNKIAEPQILYFNASDSDNEPDWSQFDYIINCIGIIKPYCKDDDPLGVLNAIKINALFPHKLAERASGAKIIQIATDCVFSGVRGPSDESAPHDATDVYGKTKSLGEVRAPNFLNIRCSIIGPELSHKLSLLEWFLAQPNTSEVNGFAHHTWNGVTTLQFARLCEAIITKHAWDSLRSVSHLHHFVPNESVNKFQLLTYIADAFNKPIKIKQVSDIGAPIDRSLASQYNNLLSLYPSCRLLDALKELVSYMKEHWHSD